MDEIRELEQAILALKSQRQALGAPVVETAVAAMRLKLEELRQDRGREELKQVTVLFSDLVGFTALSEQLDPEQMRDALDRYLRLWYDCIRSQGGVVEKFIGDAVMAVFGLAVAKEDDPQSAVAAAFCMHRNLAELNRDLERQLGIRLSMRVGIHTGPALVSTLGERPGQDFVVVGETVNLASRIQEAAPIDGILVSETTFRLIQGLFETRHFGKLSFKGISSQVAVYQVAAERRRSAQVPRRLSGSQISLVGRSAELGRLRFVFERSVEEERAWLVTITGSPGIGKTRLLAEFEGWLATRSITLAAFKAAAFEQNASIPYWLIRRLFSNWCRILDSDPIEVARTKFELNLSSHFTDAAQMKTHWIGALLGFDFSNSPHLKESSEIAQSLRERGLKYLVEFFCAISQNAAIFILFDDIHWADAASLECLQQIVQNCPNLPLMAVCLSRQRLEDHHPEWKSRMMGANYASLWMTLRPLSLPESKQILSQVLGKKNRLPPALRDTVLSAASGNPLYLEEYLKMMMEEQILYQAQGSPAWQVDQKRLDSWHVPASLTAVIQGRLDSLASPERHLLQKASVIGGVFWDQLLEAMISTAVLAVPDSTQERGSEIVEPADLGVPLSALERRSMIARQAQSVFEGSVEYRFNQSLLREVVYETILKRQRRRDHLLIAGWLVKMVESTGRGDEFSAQIAHHFSQSGEGSQAAAWLLRAGRHAHTQGALLEALRFLDQAFETLQGSEKELLWSILLERDLLHGELGDLPARQADDAALLALAAELGDPHRKALAYRAVSGTHYLAGDMPKALEASDIALAAAQLAGDKKTENSIYGWKIPVLVAIGELSQARTIADKALNFLEELDDDLEIARALVNLSVYFITIGDYSMAVTLLERQLMLSRQKDFPRGETEGENNLGYCYTRLGRFDLACQILEKAEKQSASIHLQNLAWIQVNLGLALQYLELHEKSRRKLEEAIAEFSLRGDHYGQAFGLVYNGLALEKAGQLYLASESFEKAAALFRRISMPANAWETQAWQARCLASRGELSQAVSLAAEVWEFLQANPASVMESPVEVYLACARVFEAHGDALRLRQAVSHAHRELHERLARIGNPEFQTSFLNNIPAHQEVERLYQVLIAG